MSDLVENQEDRVSRVAAHIKTNRYSVHSLAQSGMGIL